jgi:formyltetrahydrofolate deformylase
MTDQQQATRPYILSLQCPDRPGIMAATTEWLFRRGANIADSASFHDHATNVFFMRNVFTLTRDGSPEPDDLGRDFGGTATRFAMDWKLVDAERPCPTIIAVSKFGHCLNDMLHRWRTGALPIDLRAVISNHEAMREIVEWHGVPFHHLPVNASSSADQQSAFLDIVQREGAELVVLARYMQVLGPALVTALKGRCINIHHSFLPSFKGAKPYHQAYERGVKLIGATAHYVTDMLDEGPIIEQDVQRVSHSETPEQLVALGRDIESVVLARAVGWHAEHRIRLQGHRTVIFR